jgi:protein-disulfide isomerase
VSDAVNCDTVVASAYAKLFGVPVSVWAMGFYAALGVVAFRATRGRSRGRDQSRADGLGLAGAGLLFSLYMAVISLVVLRTLCLLCAGLYAVSVAAFVAAWILASPLSASLPLLRGRIEIARRRPALATSAVAVLALILLLPGWLGAPTRMSREEVFRSNPKFFDWYTSQPVVDVPREGGHARGPDSAPIQLIEFSDFECPHCRGAHVALKDLLSRYREEVRFVFHHYPLSQKCNPSMPVAGHEHACEAAVAAECAAEQGQFDPYTNLLFANQDDLGEKTRQRVAADVGLDEKKFRECLAGADAPARVKADVEVGQRAGVRSTPTFFINGRKIEGNLQYQDWIHAFALELDKR